MTFYESMMDYGINVTRKGIKIVGKGIAYIPLVVLSFLPACGKSEREIEHERNMQGIYQLLQAAERHNQTIDRYIEPFCAELEAEKQLRKEMGDLEEKTIKEIIEETLGQGEKK